MVSSVSRRWRRSSGSTQHNRRPEISRPVKPGFLYLVSTPIGNLGDMSYRAVEVLSSTALVVAEDTRHSRRLLDHYRITTPLSSYHEHNEAKETPRLVARLVAGDSIALISDAGTPLVSDPGSDTSGVPASEINAIESPATRRATRRGVSLASLCSWYELSGVVMR